MLLFICKVASPIADDGLVALALSSRRVGPRYVVLRYVFAHHKTSQGADPSAKMRVRPTSISMARHNATGQ